MSPRPAETRRLVGRYRLDSELGRGAMGTVWSAYDEVLHRPVAVKEVRLSLVPVSERAIVRERTLREARATAMLSHPNVVTLYDVVEVDSEPYVVMELLPSRSLASYIADAGTLSQGETAEIGSAVASALMTAHRAGITHRDVKPGNVLIGTDGQIKLTDFGIARNAAESSMTQTGTVLGSPPYIAPEVAMGRAVGPPADLWGLGATLFACLEGRPPYDAGDPVSTVSAVVHGDIPRPKGHGPVQDVVRGLMVKDPTLRMPLPAVRRRLRPLMADPEGPMLSAPPAPATTEFRLPQAPSRTGDAPRSGLLPTQGRSGTLVEGAQPADERPRPVSPHPGPAPRQPSPTPPASRTAPLIGGSAGDAVPAEEADPRDAAAAPPSEAEAPEGTEEDDAGTGTTAGGTAAAGAAVAGAAAVGAAAAAPATDPPSTPDAETPGPDTGEDVEAAPPAEAGTGEDEEAASAAADDGTDAAEDGGTPSEDAAASTPDTAAAEPDGAAAPTSAADEDDADDDPADDADDDPADDADDDPADDADDDPADEAADDEDAAPKAAESPAAEVAPDDDAEDAPGADAHGSGTAVPGAAVAAGAVAGAAALASTEDGASADEASDEDRAGEDESSTALRAASDGAPAGSTPGDEAAEDPDELSADSTADAPDERADTDTEKGPDESAPATPATSTPSSGTPSSGTGRTPTPPSGTGRTPTPPSGTGRTPTPPSGTGRTPTPPSGTGRTPTPSGNAVPEPSASETTMVTPRLPESARPGPRPGAPSTPGAWSQPYQRPRRAPMTAAPRPGGRQALATDPGPLPFAPSRRTSPTPTRSRRIGIVVLVVVLALAGLVGGYVAARLIGGQPPFSVSLAPGGPVVDGERMVAHSDDDARYSGTGMGFSALVPSTWQQFRLQQPGGDIVVRYVSDDADRELRIDRLVRFYPAQRAAAYAALLAEPGRIGADAVRVEPLTVVAPPRAGAPEPVQQTVYRARSGATDDRTTWTRLIPSGTDLWVVRMTAPSTAPGGAPAQFAAVADSFNPPV